MTISEDGFIGISIANTGSFDASFTVTYDCCKCLMLLTPDEIFLESGQIKICNKSLHIIDDKEVICQCLVVLEN